MNTRIHYIMGRGRSGSTYAEGAIARKTGYPLLGESRLWPKCYVHDHRCSCGKPKTNCNFWKPIFDDLPKSEKLHKSFQAAMSRKILLPLFLPKFLVRQFYGDLLEDLSIFYQHVAAHSYSSDLLDSSKNPSFGLLLGMAPNIEIQCIHIVRNPLAVVYSWKRQRTKAGEADLYAVRKPLALAAIEWSVSNALSSIAKWRTKGKHITIRYEELGREDIFDFVKGDGKDHDGYVAHAMSGNPGGASRTQIFKLDEEWRTGLTTWERMYCSLLTKPVEVFYDR